MSDGRARTRRFRAWVGVSALTGLIGCVSAAFQDTLVWKGSGVSPIFPEQNCGAQADCSYLDDFVHLCGRDIGVAFSGGGPRAATAALGQVRALHALRTDLVETEEQRWARFAQDDRCEQPPASGKRWIDRVKYISSVSGGAWFSIIYTFSDKNEDDRKFLGAMRRPRDLNNELLDGLNGTMETALEGGNHFEHLFGVYFRKLQGEAWARAIGDTYLGRFSLNYQRNFFTAGPSSQKRLAEKIHWWRLQRGDDASERQKSADRYISIPHPNRPFLIAGASILSHERLADNSFDDGLYPVEITPLYAGSPGLGNVKGEHTHQFGGGYLETYALDAEDLKYDQTPGGQRVSAKGTIKSVRARFTLPDFMGATSSAAVETIARSALLTPTKAGFAQYSYRPVGSATGAYSPAYTFGDGEHLDNLGVLSLLARHVPKIIVFVNTLLPLQPPPDGDWWWHHAKRCANTCLQPNGALADTNTCKTVEKNCSLAWQYVTKHPELFLDDLRGLFGLDGTKRKTTVFDRAYFLRLMLGLYDRTAREGSSVYCDSYEVKGNRHFGVVEWPKSERATLCWVYLERDRGFVDEIAQSKLDSHYKHALSFGYEPVQRFPHYKTGLQNSAQILDLDQPEISALSTLTAYTLVHSADYIAAHMGL